VAVGVFNVGGGGAEIYSTGCQDNNFKRSVEIPAHVTSQNVISTWKIKKKLSSIPHCFVFCTELSFFA
jgi:hypothetical protein